MREIAFCSLNFGLKPFPLNMDFSRMSDVGIVQPKMPDFRDEPPYPITAQMSQTFQLLVNRLVAQHLLEVSQTEHNVEKRFTDEKAFGFGKTQSLGRVCHAF